MVEEEFLGWFGGVLREGGVKIVFFTLKNVFIICRSHLDNWESTFGVKRDF